jgi:hypothetical protein
MNRRPYLRLAQMTMSKAECEWWRPEKKTSNEVFNSNIDLAKAAGVMKIGKSSVERARAVKRNQPVRIGPGRKIRRYLTRGFHRIWLLNSDDIWLVFFLPVC